MSDFILGIIVGVCISTAFTGKSEWLASGTAKISNYVREIFRK